MEGFGEQSLVGMMLKLHIIYNLVLTICNVQEKKNIASYNLTIKIQIGMT